MLSLTAPDDPVALLKGTEDFRIPGTVHCSSRSRFGNLPCMIPGGHLCSHVAANHEMWTDRLVKEAVSGWENRLAQLMMDGKGLPPDVIRRLILHNKLWPELRHVVEPIPMGPETYQKEFFSKERFLVFCLETTQRNRGSKETNDPRL